MYNRYVVVVETGGFYNETAQLISRGGLVLFEPPTFAVVVPLAWL